MVVGQLHSFEKWELKELTHMSEVMEDVIEQRFYPKSVWFQNLNLTN